MACLPGWALISNCVTHLVNARRRDDGSHAIDSEDARLDLQAEQAAERQMRQVCPPLPPPTYTRPRCLPLPPPAPPRHMPLPPPVAGNLLPGDGTRQWAVGSRPSYLRRFCLATQRHHRAVREIMKEIRPLEKANEQLVGTWAEYSAHHTNTQRVDLLWTNVEKGSADCELAPVAATAAAAAVVCARAQARLCSVSRGVRG
jgi:hypothetical protein